MSGFRLGTVERLREKRLQTCGQELHAATEAVARARRLQESLRTQLRADARPGATTAFLLELDSNYRNRLLGDLLELDGEITALEATLTQRRAAWLRARADVRAVAALHERYRQSRRALLARQEQLELDEHAGTRRRVAT